MEKAFGVCTQALAAVCPFIGTAVAIETLAPSGAPGAQVFPINGALTRLVVRWYCATTLRLRLTTPDPVCR